MFIFSDGIYYETDYERVEGMRSFSNNQGGSEETEGKGSKMSYHLATDNRHLRFTPSYHHGMTGKL